MQPATSTASLSLVEPDTSYCAPRGAAYPVPHGAGVVAWICATSIGAVIALACLAAAWIGGAA